MCRVAVDIVLFMNNVYSQRAIFVFFFVFSFWLAVFHFSCATFIAVFKCRLHVELVEVVVEPQSIFCRQVKSLNPTTKSWAIAIFFLFFGKADSKSCKKRYFIVEMLPNEIFLFGYAITFDDHITQLIVKASQFCVPTKID